MSRIAGTTLSALCVVVFLIGLEVSLHAAFPFVTLIWIGFSWLMFKAARKPVSA